MKTNQSSESSHKLPGVACKVQTKPTVFDYYLQYLEQAKRFRDLTSKSISGKNSHLKKMKNILDISAQEIIDINSPALELLLDEMEVLFKQWAKESKAHRSILDYQRFFVSAICKAREAEGHPSSEYRKTLNTRLNNIRRPQSPPKSKPWSPEDNDIEALYKYANDIIAGRKERPFGRYHASTGEWSKPMPLNKVKMILAAITIESSTLGRTGEIRELLKSEVLNGKVTRIVRKMREPKQVIATIRPDLWKNVEAWMEVAPKNDERLFPYAQSTFNNIISAFMRQAGWKGRNLGLYAFRRWGLTKLQESGQSDHVIMAVSQHQSRETMLTYLSDSAEQRMGDVGREEIQSMLADLIDLTNNNESILSALLEELKKVCNLFSADEVKSMMQMNDDANSFGKNQSDYIVERSHESNGLVAEVNFNLQDDAIVEHSNGTTPTLRYGADRFTQRIGGHLGAIRPIGPPVKTHGELVDTQESDDFKAEGWFGDTMSQDTDKGESAEGRIRTCEPLRTGTSSQRR
jgi:integrase